MSDPQSKLFGDFVLDVHKLVADVAIAGVAAGESLAKVSADNNNQDKVLTDLLKAHHEQIFLFLEHWRERIHP